MQARKSKAKTNRPPMPISQLKPPSEVERLEKIFKWGRLSAIAAVLSFLRGFGIFGHGSGFLDGIEFLLFYAPLFAIVALFLLIFVLSSGITPKNKAETKKLKQITSSARLTLLLTILGPTVTIAAMLLLAS